MDSAEYEKHKWDLFLGGLADQWREMAELPDGDPDPQLLIAWATGTIQALREENTRLKAIIESWQAAKNAEVTVWPV